MPRHCGSCTKEEITRKAFGIDADRAHGRPCALIGRNWGLIIFDTVF